MAKQANANRAKRSIKTFGARIRYQRIDNRWTELPNQTWIDTKINNWVDETGNVILNISPIFQDHVADENTMYTDYLYVVTYETQEDYLRNRGLNQPVMKEVAPAQLDINPTAKEEAPNKPEQGTGDFLGLSAQIERGG